MLNLELIRTRLLRRTHIYSLMWITDPDNVAWVMLAMLASLIVALLFGFAKIKFDKDTKSYIKTFMIWLFGFVLLGISNQELLDWVSFISIIITSVIVLREDNPISEAIKSVISVIFVSFVVTYGQYISYSGTEIYCGFDSRGDIYYKMVENMALVIIPYAILMIISNRKTATNIIITLSNIICLANSILIQIKGVSLRLSDFGVAGLALKLLHTYKWKIIPDVASAILIGLAAAVMFGTTYKNSIRLPLDKVVDKLNDYKAIKIINKFRIVTIVIMLFSLSCSVYIMSGLRNTEQLLDYNVDIGAFREEFYGIPYSFYVEHIYAKADEPKDWEETIQNLENNPNKDYHLDKLVGTKDNYENYTLYDMEPETFNNDLRFIDSMETKPDHIVVILNESFNNLIGEKLDVENEKGSITPYFDSLSENTIKGYTYVPAFMGGTANTEYETLSGLPLAINSSYIYPFQTKIRHESTSIASMAKDNGYKTIGVHTYNPSGYNRFNVWGYFGIDDKYFESEFTGAETIKNYIVDKEIYDFSEGLMNENDKTFQWLVTMESHSSDDLVSKEEINKYNLKEYKVGGNLEENRKRVIESKLSVLNHCDKEFYDYLESLKNRNDKVLVVMYGDHQSLWWNSKSIDSANDKMLKRLATPFCIWANYDIPEHENIIMSSFYLPAIVSEAANMESNTYFNYLLNIYKEMPVISFNGCINKNMEFVSLDELKTKTDLINDMRAIAYGCLNKYDGNWFKTFIK